MKQPFLIIVACAAALVFAVEVFAADRTEAINPTDVGTVRAFARGQGGLGPPAPVECVRLGTCPEHLYVRFDHGTPALRGSIDVPIDIQREKDPFTGCSKFKGSGTLNGQLAVQVVGDLCTQGGIRYSLSASMQVYDDTVCGCQDAMAATGRLEMFGPIKTFGPNGEPYTLQSIATFVGGIGRPALCCS